MNTAAKTMLSFLFSIYAVSAVAQTSDEDTMQIRHLEEVTVKASRPYVKSEGGVMTVDLPEIVKGKPVTNVFEALSYLPGVMSDNGSISLAGASGVTILVNGNRPNMPVENLYQMLHAMPVSRLKKVEIMYSAAAKYHVTGAAINIILTAPRASDGLQGQVTGLYKQTHYGTLGGGLSATYAVKRWSFELNYLAAGGHSWASQDISSEHRLSGQVYDVDQEDRQKTRGLKNTLYAGIGYKVSDNSNLQLTYNAQITTGVKSDNLTYGTLGDYVSLNRFNSPRAFHNIGLVYSTAEGIKLGAEYTSYNEERRQTMMNTAQDDAVLSDQRLHQGVDNLRLYADLMSKISKGWSLSYGAEYRYADDHSRQVNFLTASDVFDDELTENTADAYVGVEGKFSFGLSLNASVKGEYYRVNKEERWNVFPQLGLTYYKIPAHVWQLSLVSDKVYPSYWELHGGNSYLNTYSMILGNPQLRPYKSYYAQLSYIFKQRYVAAMYFNCNDDYFVQLPYQSEDELKLIYQTQNFNYNNTIGFIISVPVEINKVLRSTLMTNVFHNKVKADHFHDLSFTREKVVLYTSLKNTVTFGKASPLSLSLDAYAITPSLQGLSTMSGLWRIDAGVKWSLLKGNADLVLRASDLFNTWNPTMKINYKTQHFRMKVNDMTRCLKLSLAFRFNGFKPKGDTKIDTSRYGTGK